MSFPTVGQIMRSFCWLDLGVMFSDCRNKICAHFVGWICVFCLSHRWARCLDAWLSWMCGSPLSQLIQHPCCGLACFICTMFCHCRGPGLVHFPILCPSLASSQLPRQVSHHVVLLSPCPTRGWFAQPTQGICILRGLFGPLVLCILRILPPPPANPQHLCFPKATKV